MRVRVFLSYDGEVDGEQAANHTKIRNLDSLLPQFAVPMSPPRYPPTAMATEGNGNLLF
jgi:hypothetical protein